MAAKKILRIRRTDVDSQREAAAAYALVSVEPAGPQPLDVKLVGTEGENVFAASIRQSQIRKFRDRKHNASDDHEWETILRSSLLQNSVGGHDAELLESVEIVASVADQQLSITVRKNIQGITQRLGAIPMAEDRETEIEFFEWTAIAVDAASAARDEARELQNKYEAQQVTISKLKLQLDDLIQAKHDHENALLAKFQELLNAKKLKIRDQQRLLAGAKVDPAAAAAVEQARGSTRRSRPRKAGPSRASKRKANGKTAGTDTESEIDEASRMHVDQHEAEAKQEEDEEFAEPITPEKSDLDETEDEDDEDFDAMPASRPTKSGVGSKGKAIETATGGGSSPQGQTADAPPPRRELPFAKKQQSKQMSNEPIKTAPDTAERVDEDETTDDDEL